MLQFILYSLIVLLVLFAVIITVVAKSKGNKLTSTAAVLYELTPHYDCKECGKSSCMKFAEDLIKGKTSINQCPYLKGENYMKCRQIMKKERKVYFDNVAFVKCKGGQYCKNKFEYKGDDTCSSVNLLHSGNKMCPFACLGCGDCVKACIYGAISINETGCAVIDKTKCVGCGECVYVCPNKLISLIPTKSYVEVVCKNTSDDSNVTRNCKVSCIHCEECVKNCPYDAIKMVGGLPNIDVEKCQRCGKCVAVCPNHVISRI